jgi:hypothetical protein
MKLVKISLVLLVVACCMPAMAYKTAKFQQGIANADAGTDANYKMDFVCLAAAPGLKAQHFSNGYHTAYVGYESESLGATARDSGTGTVAIRWNLQPLRGKVKYIHSAKMTLWAKAATYDRNAANKGGFNYHHSAPYKNFEWGYINTDSLQYAGWGDADPTTQSETTAGIASKGATYTYFGTATLNTGVVWEFGTCFNNFGDIGSNPDGSGSRAVVRANSLCTNDDLATSTILTFNLNIDAVESWMAPEVRAYRGVTVYPNNGIALKLLTTNGLGGSPGYPWEGYYFCDDQVDETVEATYHGPLVIVTGEPTLSDTVDTVRNLTPAVIRNKNYRPLLEVFYEEGTNVPVELSSFDVE